MMLNWWQTLSKREQKLLALGSLIVLICLNYVLLFHPLANKLTEKASLVAEEAELLSWMQQQAPRILAAQASPTLSVNTASTLLSAVDLSLHQSPLSTAQAQLSQQNAARVAVQFNQVNFNQLTLWLLTMQKQGIYASEASLVGLSSPGLVQARLILQRS